MNDIVKKNSTAIAVSMQQVEDKIAVIRGMEVIADADVAALYGVQTKEVNQAVRNNPDKFPACYMFELTSSELDVLRSKILTTNVSAKNRTTTKVFTERGLYMLATILNVRELKRELLDLHQETDREVRPRCNTLARFCPTL